MAVLVFDAEAADREMEEYLDLCAFVMSDATPQCHGLLLRGSSQFLDRAIKLLADLKGDYDLAKLHILYPAQMMIADTRIAMEEMVRNERPSIKQVIADAVSQLKEER